MSADLQALAERAEALERRLQELSRERRATRVASRLFALPTEALVGTAGFSAAGILGAAAAAAASLVPVVAIVGALVPMAMLGSATGGMLWWRWRARQIARAHGDDRLLFLDEEIRAASTDPRTPKAYLEDLYSLRRKVIEERLDTVRRPRLIEVAAAPAPTRIPIASSGTDELGAKPLAEE